MSVPPPPAQWSAPERPTSAEPQPAPPISDGLHWWMPLVGFVIALGASVVAFAIFAGIAGDADAPGVTIAATFVQDIALVVAMVVLARASGIRATPAAFGLRPPEGGRALEAAVGVFLAFYVFLLIWSQLDPGAEDDLLTDLGADKSTAILIAVAVLTTIVAPITEELFFRGFLFGALRHAMRWGWAAVIAGVIFGGVHAGGTPVLFLVPLAVFGALLCVLYQRTKSLIPGMGVHAFNNALALGVGLEWTPGQVISVLIAAPLVVMAMASAVANR